MSFANKMQFPEGLRDSLPPGEPTPVTIVGMHYADISIPADEFVQQVNDNREMWWRIRWLEMWRLIGLFESIKEMEAQYLCSDRVTAGDLLTIGDWKISAGMDALRHQLL